MMVRPYIQPGNRVLYSHPSRKDVRTVVTVERVDPLVGVWVRYADGDRVLCDESDLHVIPESWMKPVASIRQPSLDDLLAEYEAMDGDVSAAPRLKRKYGMK